MSFLDMKTIVLSDVEHRSYAIQAAGRDEGLRAPG